MKNVFTIVMLAAALTAFLATETVSSANNNQAAKAQPNPADSEEQIKQLERDRQQAFVQGDIALLDRETAEDYTTINASGKISTKAQMMSNLRAGKTKVQAVTLDEMGARIFGNTAVLTGLYADSSVTDGVQKQGHARFTRIFVKSNGQWQAVAYQQTSIATP